MKKAKEFKNIPSLGAITTRALRVDNATVLPEAEPVEDPQTPGVMMTPSEHPLQHSWYATFILSFF